MCLPSVLLEQLLLHMFKAIYTCLTLNKNGISSTCKNWYIEQTKFFTILESFVVTSENFAFHLQLRFDCVWRSQVIYSRTIGIVENWNRRQF